MEPVIHPTKRTTEQPGPRAVRVVLPGLQFFVAFVVVVVSVVVACGVDVPETQTDEHCKTYSSDINVDVA